MRTVHIVVRVPGEWRDFRSDDVNKILQDLAECLPLPLPDDPGCGEESTRLSLWLDAELLEKARANVGLDRDAELVRRVIATFRPLLKEAPADGPADEVLARCTACGTEFLRTPWPNAKLGRFVYAWCYRCRANQDFQLVTRSGLGTS